jgi:predicted helicase
MRQSLSEAFQRSWLLDLHGSAKKLETARGGGKEENVFDIQQGVAIGGFLRTSSPTVPGVAHAELWGFRESKYHALNSTSVMNTVWTKLKPEAPHYFFVPRDFSGRSEYERFPSLSDVFSIFQNGVKTDRDDLFFDFNRDDLEQRIRKFYAKKYDAEFVERFGLHASSSYDIEARRDQTTFSRENIQRCL